MNRRDFLRAGLAGGALAPFASALGASAGQVRAVSLVADPADPIVTAAPAQWALGELQQRLESAGVRVTRRDRTNQAGPAEICIVASGARSPTAVTAMRAARATAPAAAESLVLMEATIAGRPAVLAGGADVRGLVYALLELADRVRLSPPDAALRIAAPIVERPANPVRSVMRQFTSETLDTPWFFDRDMWPRYLSMLATQRFNRLHLGFGLGYDTLQGVTDSKLLFLYPFVVDVPGATVRLTNFTDADRARHLEMLRFISEQTVAHGLDFQLGIWMHGYQLLNSPRARYLVEGLTADNHATYCRDALTAVLKACPAISAVALRIHGESGIAEGSYDFWRTVFDGVARSGRKVEIDLHAKGLDAQMIDHALATGMPVNVSPKYWAEHLGMPYHQAAIRDLEMPVEGRVGRGLMTLSEGARVFTRYGYADFLRDDRKYTVRHRVFAGTQRLLLSGDPRAAASYARMFQFCGSTGMDLMEPLTCRGRRGTGAIGGLRSGYVDARLEPKWDWEKYEYWYRTWGRLTYNPETAPDVWRRQWSANPGQATAIEAALSAASRILPIVTTAHLPSAACDAYWPEVYWNQPMAAVPTPNPYGDTPVPRTFQYASPLDPQLFSTVAEHAEELLKGTASGKYSPVEVAEALETLADSARRNRVTAGAPPSPELERIAIDVDIQTGLGHFFGAKFRAGVLFAVHEKSGDRRALEQAIEQYRRARDAWAALSKRAEGVYAAELAASDKISNRGQWADRLPAIDRDIDQMSGRVASATASADARVASAVAAALAHPRRSAAPVVHVAPPAFRPGQPLTLTILPAAGRTIASVRLSYRHVNQAERFESVDMTRGAAGRFAATIPATYTASPYPLQYYFTVSDSSGAAWIAPGFDEDLSNLPYVVLRRA